MAEIKDGGLLERMKDFFAEQAQFNKERMLGEAQARRGATEMMPTPAQAAWAAAQFAPGAALVESAGEGVGPPSGDVGIGQAFSGEKMLSAAENWERGNYADALLQGLGSFGDVVSLGGPLGVAAGTIMKVPGMVGKIAKAAATADRGIGALDTNLPAVQPPIRSKEIYQEFGIDEVRKAEAALKRKQGDLDSVEAMVKRAEAVNPSFQANIDSIANSVGGKKADKYIKAPDGSDFDVEVKTQKSITSKIKRRGLTPADFTDGVRTTIYIDKASQAEEAVDQIGRLYTTIDRGWQRIPETGYFDRKLNILVPDKNGKMIVAEVQIKTPEMHEAALIGHKLYDQSREMERIYAVEKGSPKFDIPPERKAGYDALIAGQQKVYGDAAAVTDPEIRAQLVDKFMKGGAVVAGPRFFRMSFQN